MDGDVKGARPRRQQGAIGGGVQPAQVAPGRVDRMELAVRVEGAGEGAGEGDVGAGRHRVLAVEPAGPGDVVHVGNFGPLVGQEIWRGQVTW